MAIKNGGDKAIAYSDEDVARASRTDLVEYLRSRGEKLERSGSEYKWITSLTSSTTIRGNTWYRHATGDGGDAIDFIRHFYNASFQQAVDELLHRSLPVVSVEPSKAEPRLFVLPPRNHTTRHIERYLCEDRGIGKHIVDHFISEGTLYEDSQYHNCVFIGRDEDGVPRYAHKRSSHPGSSFRQDVAGSDKRNCAFKHLGSNAQLFIFEAPIDMLSHITLHPDRWYENSYLSLGGLNPVPLLKFLERNEMLTEISLCLDNDEAGRNASSKIASVLEKQKFTVQSCFSKMKDWNDNLIFEEQKEGPFLKDMFIGF